MTSSRVITRANVGDMIGVWLVLEVEKATTGTEVGRTRYLTRCPKCKRGEGLRRAEQLRQTSGCRTCANEERRVERPPRQGRGGAREGAGRPVRLDWERVACACQRLRMGAERGGCNRCDWAGYQLVQKTKGEVRT